MHRLTIQQFRYVADTQQYVADTVAVFRVDENGVELERGTGVAYGFMRVPDPSRDESIAAEDDPLRWAELMAGYLGGDVRASFEPVIGEGTTVIDVYHPDADAAVHALHTMVTRAR